MPVSPAEDGARDLAGDVDVVLARAGEVVAMLGVLGLDPRAEQWAAGSGTSGDAAAGDALGSLIETLIAQRTEARANKDFATSDAIRDRLLDAGIALEDTPNQTRWSLT